MLSLSSVNELECDPLYNTYIILPKKIIPYIIHNEDIICMKVEDVLKQGFYDSKNPKPINLTL